VQVEGGEWVNVEDRDYVGTEPNIKNRSTRGCLLICDNIPTNLLSKVATWLLLSNSVVLNLFTLAPAGNAIWQMQP
jgi:hypothetical protein